MSERPQSANSIHRSTSKDINDFHTTQKVNEIRVDRKKIEDEAKILENRIKLLQLEEIKASKAIEETKKKMQDILKARLRVQEKAIVHEQIKMRKIKESQDKFETNQKLRELNKIRVEASKENLYNKIKIHAQDVLKESIEKKIMASKENTLDMKKKLENILEIKQQEQSLAIKKAYLEQEKALIRKSNYQTKVNKELERKSKKMLEVSKLEHKESKMIKKLQNTQMAQISIYESYKKLKESCGNSNNIDNMNNISIDNGRPRSTDISLNLSNFRNQKTLRSNSTSTRKLGVL